MISAHRVRIPSNLGRRGTVPTLARRVASEIGPESIALAWREITRFNLEELCVDVALVQSQYPRGVSVESLSERSGNREHRPKQLLERIAQLKHRADSTDFREAVGARTDPAALARTCPRGFAPFADRLRNAFGQR